MSAKASGGPSVRRTPIKTPQKLVPGAATGMEGDHEGGLPPRAESVRKGILVEDDPSLGIVFL